MYPIHYEDDIRRNAFQYELDPFLIAAIIRVESNYKPDTESNKGAYGLMQLMPDTSNWIIEKAPFDTEYKKKIRHPGGQHRARLVVFALDGQTIRRKYACDDRGLQCGAWQSQPMAAGEGVDGTLQNANQIPYGETRHYIQRVMYYYNKYHKLYGDEWSRG